MEALIAITIIVFAGGAVFTYNSSRKATLEAQRLADAEARRRRKEQDEARRRRIEQEEARLREAERLAALRESIKIAIKVAVSAAIEATIAGTGIAANESKVVHIVASAIEAAGVAESANASIQTREGAIEAALQTSITDAIARSNTNATIAARKAASLEPNDRSVIIRVARVAAIEETMAIAIKDALANLRGNNEYRRITNVRKNTKSLRILTGIGDGARDIEKDRSKQIQQARISETERIEAIIQAIEPANDSYARIASSFAASERAHAIKETRRVTRKETTRAIIARAMEAVIQDEDTLVEATEGAKIAKIMAEVTTNVIDKIEDAIEDAVALTSMRLGSIQEAVEPAIANAIEISINDVVIEVIENARNDRIEEELADGNISSFHQEDGAASQLNVPIENYESLPRLESPAGYVYLIQEIEFSNLYKIGRTNHPATRSSFVDLKTPGKTELVAILKSINDKELESEFHKKYETSRKQGEWFDLTGIQVREICGR